MVRGILNIEGGFGLAFTVWLCYRSAPRSTEPARAVHSRWWLAAILALTALCFARALPFDFLSDEFVHIAHARTTNRDYARYTFTHAGGDGFFRPLGYMSLRLEALWAGINPSAWHLSGLLLHLSVCVLLYLVTRHLFSGDDIALWATALFAVRGAHVEAVSYMAARFDLLATVFVMAGMLLYLRYLDSMRIVTLLCSLMCVFCALLSKESAYVFPFLATLILYWRGKISRWRTTIPFWILTAILFAYRWTLLGGIGGYKGDHVSFPGIVKGLGVRLWAIFYFPVNWSTMPEPYLWAAMSAAAIALLWLGRARSTQLLLPLGFILISILPVIHLLLIGSDLLGSLHLYLPSIGFSLLLAVALHGLQPNRARIAVGLTLVVFQIAALQHNFTSWGKAASLARRTCEFAAAQIEDTRREIVAMGLPKIFNGSNFFRNGFPECVQMRYGAPVRVSVLPRDAPPPMGAKAFVWENERLERIY